MALQFCSFLSGLQSSFRFQFRILASKGKMCNVQGVIVKIFLFPNMELPDDVNIRWGKVQKNIEDVTFILPNHT